MDYELVYFSNDAPGTGVAVMEGIGRFEGQRVISFRIVSQSELWLDPDDYGQVQFEQPLYHDELREGTGYYPVYLSEGGEVPHPEFRVYVDLDESDYGQGVLLEEGVDYEVVGWRTAESEVNGYRVASVEIQGVGEVSGGARGVFLIADRVDVSKLPLSTYSLEQTEYVYRGSAVRPKLTYDPDFVEGRDYYLAYSNNNGVGTCTVSVLGMGRFYGLATIEVPIVASCSAPDLAACVVELVDGQDLRYTGRPVCPAVRVTDPATGKVLREARDYMLVYRDNVDVGTATAQVLPTRALGYGPYQGQTSLSFEIQRSDISGFAAERVSDATYTGKAVEPTIRIVDTHSGRHMAPGADYTVTYSNNVTVGTATATVTGVGNYEGTLSTTFRIVGKPASKLTVSAIANKTYTGSAIKPALTVKDGGKTLKSGTDYKVTYKNNTKVGTATVTITGLGNYRGTKSATFKIVAASVAKATVSKVANQRYDGTAKRPTPTVKLGGKTLKKGTDYTLAYKNNVKAGTATVTIKGKGNYAGSKSVTFKVVAQKGTWTKVGSKWRYVWADKKYPKSVFLDISGKTYYFDANGYMATGWKTINKKSYYFDSSGVMAKSKWVGDYYLKADGTMARNEWVDGGRYHVDKNGKYDKKR